MTDAFEFFVKDTLDLQKYDIIYISGSKNGRISIDKIVRTSRDILVEEAQKAKKYDPIHTAIYVKILRMKEQESILDKENI